MLAAPGALPPEAPRAVFSSWPREPGRLTRAATSAPGSGSGLGPLVVVLTGYVLAGFAFGRYLLSLLAPEFVQAGVFSYATFGLIAGLNQAGYVIASLGAGRLAGRFDPRRLLLISMLVLTAALAAMALARAPVVIAGLALIMGLCTAGSWVPQITLVRGHIARARSGWVLAVVASGTAFGTMLTGSSVPWIVAQFGWPSAWALCAVVAGALFLAGLLVIPGWQAVREPADGTQAVGNLEPARGTIPRLYLMMFLSGAGAITAQNYLAAYLNTDLGYTTGVAGAAWVAIGLGGTVSGFLIGHLADRSSTRKAIAAGHLAMAAAIAAVASVSSAALILGAAGLFGLVYFGTFGLFASYLTKFASAQRVGPAYGLGNLLLGVGGAGGAFAGGQFGDYLGMFAPLLYICAGLCAAVALVAVGLEDDARSAERAEASE